MQPDAWLLFVTLLLDFYLHQILWFLLLFILYFSTGG